MLSSTVNYNHNRLLTRVTPPAGEPISLAEAKLYLRVDHNFEDDLIEDMITSIRLSAENHLKQSLMTQTWKVAFDSVPQHCPIPMGPIASVSSVSLVSETGSSTTLSTSSYQLNAAKNRVIFDSITPCARVEITYVAGYGNATAVPQPIKYGMLSHLAQLYDQRGDADAGIPQQSIALYQPYRDISL